MEDATIPSSPFQQVADNQCPFVLTTDDLMMEVTKLYLNNLNKERVLGSIAGKLKLAEDFVVKSQETQTENQKSVDQKIVILQRELVECKNELANAKKSNQLFSVNNKNLDEALTKVRAENRGFADSNKIYSDKNTELDTEVIKLKNDNAKLSKLKNENVKLTKVKKAKKR
jgi:hypothetical protein